MRVVAIVQARMGSTRLPAKVLKSLAGAPMLARVVNRLELTHSLDDIVIATTTMPADVAIVSLCNRHGWKWRCGSIDDVLDRYYQTALSLNADIVVRITSDCPFIDPHLVDRVIHEFKSGRSDLDYASNSLVPRTYPRGLDVEVMKFDALARAWREDDEPATREHVTPYIWRHPTRFNLLGVYHEEDLSSLRWTVDTEEDLAFARTVYEHFGHDSFSWTEMLSLVKEHPEWQAVNQGVVQKKVS